MHDPLDVFISEIDHGYAELGFDVYEEVLEKIENNGYGDDDDDDLSMDF